MITQEQKNDLENVMNTVSGRRFMWRLLNTECGFFKTAYTGNSGTYYNEGKQDVGRSYFDDIMDVCPDLFNKMWAENNNRKKKEQSDADRHEG